MKKLLYLGIDPPEAKAAEDLVHCALIAIIARPMTDPAIAHALHNFAAYTHLIFTSKSAARIFLAYAPHYGITRQEMATKHLVAVGRRTAKTIGIPVQTVAQNETAEGIIAELEQLDLRNAQFLWPHSALSRPVISNWLYARGIAFRDIVLYDVISKTPHPLPDLNHFDEIVFTSPSTVDAFLNLYDTLPRHVSLTAIGPITAAKLKQLAPMTRV